MTNAATISGLSSAPAFAAYASANQSLSANVLTKVNIDTKVFDTASCFNTTTSAYTPNVLGYYMFSGMYNSSAAYTGAIYAYFNNIASGQNYQAGRAYFSSDYPAMNVSILLYMNGTTDSVTFNVGTTGNSTSQGGLMFSRFSAVLVRGA